LVTPQYERSDKRAQRQKSATTKERRDKRAPRQNSVRQINTVTRQDFEKAAVNVFTEEFPNSRLQGCFFHFSQAIYRHVQSAELQASYAANPEFALMLRHLPALAFVPIQNVQDYLVIVHFNYFWNFRVFFWLDSLRVSS
jgi:hypothetical protein